ncbi:zinc finger CCCH domain-containing protein 11A isoform X2 [Pseudophryne corroboree]|uniref:zinc finger CCCH domain-containing protein 11A isoform X2 n=1 Tax=Pseudophryne corroboree TaxID=495146 RepID=UPI00308197F8
MSSKGDDCYFYFYSTCTKGDSCPFRHCEAALGNETVCNLWQDGCCFRQICKFRHMSIDKRRSEIPCYWEKQPSGCQKANCAFHHAKGRYVEGLFLPPSKTQIPQPEACEAEPPISPLSQAPSKLSVVPTPQLRGVKKIEATENVPSPTHPPVVINAADDDEDDDDQFSEEGEEMKNSKQPHLSPGGRQGGRVVSSRKSATPKKGLLGIPAYSNALDSSAVPIVSETNIPVVRTITFANNDPPSRHNSLAKRLGKHKMFTHKSPLAVPDEGRHTTVKKPLSERLGVKISLPTDSSDAPPEKAQIQRRLKDRLGLPAEQNSTEMERAANPTAEFRVKTLQEIRLEKANQRKEQEVTGVSSSGEDSVTASSKPPLSLHRKSFYDILAEKRLRQLNDGVQKDDNKPDKDLETGVDQGAETQVKAQNLNDKKQKQGGQSVFSWSIRRDAIKQHVISNTAGSNVDSKKQNSVNLKETKVSSQSIEQVRVKTLEEIRQEKALRHQQAIKSEGDEASSPLRAASSHTKIMRISKRPVCTEVKVDEAVMESNLPTNVVVTVEDTKCPATITPHMSGPGKTANVPEDDNTQLMHLEDGNDVDSVKPTEIILEKENKGKAKVVKKRRALAKAARKQIAPEGTFVAEVKPLSSAVTCTEKERMPVSLPAVDSSTVQHPVKRRRIGTASIEEPSTPTVDDFDDLIWGTSDGKMEAEIYLDPNKDEDDLLMELSEMIDS